MQELSGAAVRSARLRGADASKAFGAGLRDQRTTRAAHDGDKQGEEKNDELTTIGFEEQSGGVTEALLAEENGGLGSKIPAFTWFTMDM